MKVTNCSHVNGYIAYLKRSKQGANEPGSSHTNTIYRIVRNS